MNDRPQPRTRRGPTSTLSWILRPWTRLPRTLLPWPLLLGACSPEATSGAGPVGSDRGDGRGYLGDRGRSAAPDVGSTLTVTVRTGDGAGDGANRHVLSLCLAEDRCFPLDVPQSDTMRPGGVDVFHLPSFPLAATAIDRVELRSLDGQDTFRPACVAIALDGEPLHCAERDYPLLGIGPDADAASYRDPDGLHLACGSCVEEPLTHGPMVGAVEADRARLWVRTDGPREVEVAVVDQEHADAAVLSLVARPEVKDDFTTHFDVEGLRPNTRYRAFFDVDGEPAVRSASFRTAPVVGTPGVLRLGFGSCSRGFPQPIFDVVRAERPDLFLFGGDNHYADSSDLGSHWAELRLALEDPSRAALLRETPTLAIWDDHDFVGNDSHGGSPGGATALRAFEDYWANASLGTAATPGVFSTFTWGDVELFLLDVRTYRSPPGDEDGSLLGEAQTAWLKERLRASKATFKLLVSGTIWSPSIGETWEDVPDAREDLFDFLGRERIGGVVLLAGDLHRSMLRRIHRPEAYALPEIIASPFANRNWRCPPKLRAVDEIACVDDGNAFALFEIDTTRPDPHLLARIVGQDGVDRARLEVKASELR